MDHLSSDLNGLNELSVGLSLHALLEELVGLLPGLSPQFAAIGFDSGLHFKSSSIEDEVWLDSVELQGA